MKDIKAKILSNEKISSGYFKVILDAPFVAEKGTPGQFVQIQCSDTIELLFRRPFSIHKVEGKGIEILYEVIGKGTELLSRKKKGDFLNVLGPLGSGFKVPSTSAILIAGGMGVAPLVFLAERLKKTKIMVLIGAKTKKDLLCENDFKKIATEVHIATDDGSKGYKGFVSELFEKLLRETANSKSTKVYTCGPPLMLKSIAGICKKKKIECEVSVEEKMACGIGACLGCAVKVKGSNKNTFIYKLACKDGPVFNAQEIVWD